MPGDEAAHVLPTLAQHRDLDGEQNEPEGKILAEPAVGNLHGEARLAAAPNRTAAVHSRASGFALPASIPSPTFIGSFGGS